MRVGSFGCHLYVPKHHLQCSQLSAAGKPCLSKLFLRTVWASKDCVNKPAAERGAGLAQRLKPCLLRAVLARVTLGQDGAAGDGDANVTTQDQA